MALVKFEQKKKKKRLYILRGNWVCITVTYVIPLEVNHVRSLLKNLIAIHVIGIC